MLKTASQRVCGFIIFHGTGSELKDRTLKDSLAPGIGLVASPQEIETTTTTTTTTAVSNNNNNSDSTNTAFVVDSGFIVWNLVADASLLKSLLLECQGDEQQAVITTLRRDQMQSKEYPFWQVSSLEEISDLSKEMARRNHRDAWAKAFPSVLDGIKRLQNEYREKMKKEEGRDDDTATTTAESTTTTPDLSPIVSISDVSLGCDQIVKRLKLGSPILLSDLEEDDEDCLRLVQPMKEVVVKLPVALKMFGGSNDREGRSKLTTERWATKVVRKLQVDSPLTYQPQSEEGDPTWNYTLQACVASSRTLDSIAQSILLPSSSSSSCNSNSAVTRDDFLARFEQIHAAGGKSGKEEKAPIPVGEDSVVKSISEEGRTSFLKESSSNAGGAKEEEGEGVERVVNLYEQLGTAMARIHTVKSPYPRPGKDSTGGGFTGILGIDHRVLDDIDNKQRLVESLQTSLDNDAPLVAGTKPWRSEVKDCAAAGVKEGGWFDLVADEEEDDSSSNKSTTPSLLGGQKKIMIPRYEGCIQELSRRIADLVFPELLNDDNEGDGKTTVAREKFVSLATKAFLKGVSRLETDPDFGYSSHAPAVLCHMDMGAGNVLVATDDLNDGKQDEEQGVVGKQKGKEKIVIIDWADSTFGCKEADMQCLYLDLAGTPIWECLLAKYEKERVRGRAIKLSRPKGDLPKVETKSNLLVEDSQPLSPWAVEFFAFERALWSTGRGEALTRSTKRRAAMMHRWITETPW